ncbi:glucan endo-1,3-beta-glucosidase 8 [Citrus sinensis]|uniref:Glucan endo-1,3-beta-glucosidase 8 n=1 Tax=Citrus sinensis TaxID=2711 RepID=A0ACB8LAD8_CITSI|nr:glucan endo-1,3-beta-glucosidase 8 [Citrus sinensis]
MILVSTGALRVLTSHQLPSKTIVQMLKDNGISKVKLFDADQDTMTTLAGSDIEVMVAIPNKELLDMNSYDRVKQQGNGKWNIRHFRMLTATENIQNAFNDAGVGDSVKASVPLNADVYESPENNPYPSFGRFRTDILGQTAQIVKFLAKNNVPFAVNIYPFPSPYGNDDFPFNYVFFDGALKAVDHGDMAVIVGEKARLGYAGGVPARTLRCLTNKGTPLQPRYIEVYWLLDEDAKSTDPGNFERHWGIFRYDGQSQFAMVLLVQGQNKMLKGARGVKYRVQGQNKMLKGARGVKYMPSQWCMLNPGAKDMSKLVDNINYACTWLDCTALGYDISCNNLDANGNASYAFNMFR